MRIVVSFTEPYGSKRCDGCIGDDLAFSTEVLKLGQLFEAPFPIFVVANTTPVDGPNSPDGIRV